MKITNITKQTQEIAEIYSRPTSNGMKKISLMILGAMIMATPFVANAMAEIHVTNDGKAAISSAKVIQISGSTFFTRLYWGDAFIRFTVKANSSTKFMRATGEATTRDEIAPGDLLDVTGELEPQSDTLSLIASSVKNSSVQKEQSAVAGNIVTINLATRQFTMGDAYRGLVTVNVSTSTQFVKGSRIIDLEHLRLGDRITKASGDYDIPSKTLAAQFVIVYIDANIFKAQNYVAKLVETPTITSPQTLKVLLNKKEYTVYVNDKTIFMKTDRSITTLQRFVAGDPIKFYGAIREVDEPIIDAEVVRNLNL